METNEYNKDISVLLPRKNLEEFEKQRKLTTDSGFGDDEHVDAVNNEFIDITLERINENNSHSLNYQNMENLAKSYEKFSCRSDVEEKGKKQRRVTPVPRRSPIDFTKLSLKYPSFQRNLSSPSGFLFLEEEDADDVENYNSNDDYICPDILTCERYTRKRNSWHGTTEQEAARRRDITFTKSKSFDCVKERTRKNNCTMDTSNNTYRLTIDKVEMKSFYEKHHNNNMDNGEKENQQCPIEVFVEPANNSYTGSLPLWMKEADAEMTSSDTGSGCSGDESCFSPEEETVSSKLQIPAINWAKLNETKNKNNELLTKQRRNIAKQRNRNQRRRRKLTPSESPSASSLEKLCNLKTVADEWKVVEEEEEEEDEEGL